MITPAGPGNSRSTLNLVRGFVPDILLLGY
jgi:hypothetical protein